MNTIKKLFLPFLIILLGSISSFAQDSKFQSVEAIDQYIEAVKSKIEHVKSDPEQHERALDMGWYDQMNGYIKSALKEKERLLAKEEKE